MYFFESVLKWLRELFSALQRNEYDAKNGIYKMNTEVDMDKAFNLIKQYEGLRLQAYMPIEGSKNGFAIGYGWTNPVVTKECVISEAWAEQLLRDHVRKEVIVPLATILQPPKPMSENQLCAVISLVYNIGVTQFKSSTMLRKLNAGDFAGAAAQFDVWNKSNGKVLPGLVKRRAAERALYETP